VGHKKKNLVLQEHVACQRNGPVTRESVLVAKEL
jgi:hypothetical protein